MSYRHAILFIALLLTGCLSGAGTTPGTAPVNGGGSSSTLGNPVLPPTQIGPAIRLAMCKVINRCNSSVPVASCERGISGTEGLAERLGLYPTVYGAFSSVVSAESSGSILANLAPASRCLLDLESLSCGLPEVLAAYDALAPRPYGGAGSMLSAAQSSCAGVFASPNVFADGFESGEQSIYSFVSPMGSVVPHSLVPGGCRSGGFCGVQSLGAGVSEQISGWYKGIRSLLPDRTYVRGFWKFPTDWRFSEQPGRIFTVLRIFGESCARGGVVVELRSRGGDGASADLWMYSIENTDRPWLYHRGPEFTPDGAWHSIEVYTSVADRKLRLWWDGIPVIDADDVAGNCVGSEVGFGAYVNHAIPRAQKFYVDDLAISTRRIGP